MLSYEEIGAAAVLSRTIAGAVGTKLVACLPGSRNAVRLAVEKLLAPEIPHIVFELKKHQEDT
jgi:molybdenum cofactor biosynthesis protein B